MERRVKRAGRKCMVAAAVILVLSAGLSGLYEFALVKAIW